MPPVTALSSSPLGTILRVEGLTFHVPQRVLFAGWSARIGPGVTLMQGGESSGKSTLLRLLAGDLAAQAGSLQLGDLSLPAQSQAWSEQVFWIDPATRAFDALSALQFFELQRQRYPGFWLADAPDWAELLAGLALTEHLAKPLYMLSTGSRRKVWLAAAFASGVTLTLLDEPFAALDKASIRCVMQQLDGATRWSDRACVLADYTAPEGLELAQCIDLGH
jgi:ABC-type multidrug transport system ATPase subunit